MNKKFVFYLLLILSFFCLTGAFLFSDELQPYRKTTFSIEAPDNSEILIKNGAKIYKPSHENGAYNITLTGKIKNPEVTGADKEKIKSIVVFIGNDIQYFNNLKAYKSANINNALPKLSYTAFILNKVAKGAFLLIPFYVLFFAALFYYIKINPKPLVPKEKYVWEISFFLVLMAVVLRLDGLFSYNFHLDEYASIYFSNPIKPLSYIFEDSGNPPLYYLILRYWMKIFGSNFETIKLLPFCISLFGLFSFWFFIKKETSNKFAILGLLTIAFLPALIYQAQELRSYILQAAIMPLGVYFFFKILNTKKTKYYIFYFFFAAFAFNLHYYTILFLIFNFVFALIYFIRRNEKNELLKFLNINIFALLTFVPWASIIMENSSPLNCGFNEWIILPDFNILKNALFYVFFGVFSFFLSLFFFIRALFIKNKTKVDKILIYLFLFIIFVFFFALLFSYLIKPIFVERYFTFLIPLSLSFFILSIYSIKNFKFAPLIFIIWFLLIQNSGYVGETIRQKGIIDYPLISSHGYIGNKTPYAVTNTNPEDFNFKHKKYLTKKVHYEYETSLSLESAANKILKEDKNALIFVALIDENKIKGKFIKFYNPYTKSSLYKISN